MNEFDIEVVGARKPRKPDNSLKRFLRQIGRLVRAFFLRPRVVILTGLAAYTLFVGTPHVGWDYKCRHSRRATEPCRSALYCAYYGIQGRRVVYPEYGKPCRFITFVPLDLQRMM